MMRTMFRLLSALTSLVLLGCSFDPSVDAVDFASDGGNGVGPGNTADGMTADSDGSSSASDAAPDGANTLSLCDPSYTDLVACYAFEDSDGTSSLTDQSPNGNHASVSGALFGVGVEGAALLASSSLNATVADSSSLDTPDQLTLEMWLYPDASVSSGRQGLFDNQGQYGFFITATDALRCTAASHAVASQGGILVPGTWQHVACVYDGAEMRLYRNGVLVGTTIGTGAIGTSSTVGAGIAQDSPDGDDLVGKIDSLRIWKSARSATELCNAGGFACP